MSSEKGQKIKGEVNIGKKTFGKYDDNIACHVQ